MSVLGEPLPSEVALVECARLQHPGVVQIHELFELNDGTPILVMELLDGLDLVSVQCREPIWGPAAAQVMADVVAIVRAAHAARVVHGNLNPLKVLLCKGAEGPNLRVLDFGNGRLLDSAREPPQDPIASRQPIIGRAFYLAPEQFHGVAEFDERADVYALGVMLYEYIYSCGPGTAFIARSQRGCPELPEGICPDRIRALVLSMLADKPDERLGSLDEAEALLREWAAEGPGAGSIRVTRRA